MSAVTLRAAVADDVAFLTGCFLRGMKESIAASRGKWDEDRERQQFESQLELPLTQVIVFRGAEVGFMVVVPERQSLRIFTLCITPERQGCGIGSEVIRRVVADARARGCDTVLSVLKPNVRAQALYERLGFRVVGESERHRHLMHAQLQSRAG